MQTYINVLLMTALVVAAVGAKFVVDAPAPERQHGLIEVKQSWLGHAARYVHALLVLHLSQVYTCACQGLQSFETAGSANGYKQSFTNGACYTETSGRTGETTAWLAVW